MSYDNIKLEKGLYTTGKSFTKTLEELDPSENYIGTPLEGLDAFERQLKRFDIKVSGPDSDCVSKFYSTSTSSVLFPEYISRVVKAGIESNSKVENIIATTTEIDSLDYRSLSYADDMNFELALVNEGGQMSECEISLSDKLTTLTKYGKVLKASYEALKFQKLDLFSITLSKIGEQISYTQFSHAFNAVVDEHTKSITADDVTYETLVKLWMELQPYNMTTLVTDKKTATKLLNLTELRDANAGLDFHGTGRFITPFGAEIIVYDQGTDYGAVAIDRNYAIERVQAGGVVTEFDKIIDCQFERAAISTIVGFAPIYRDAIVTLPIN